MLELLVGTWKTKKETMYFIKVYDEDMVVFQKTYKNSSRFQKKYDFLNDVFKSYYDEECSKEDVLEVLEDN